MHQLPIDFSLDHFIGLQITQICIDNMGIQIHIDDENISGSGAVSLTINSDTTEIFHLEWKTTSGLESVIGATVEKWTKNSELEFCLSLSSDVKLSFKSQKGPYEDFTISDGSGGLWVL
jgi:hypothetical protein